jgi:hypothetical protein
MWILILIGLFFSACSDLQVDYEIRSGQGFSDIQGAYSDKDALVYNGYMYYFSTFPVIFDKPWETATLHSPAAVNSGNDMLQCYQRKDGLRVTLNFYCGGAATVPAKPPVGSYQVNVGSKSYNFNGVDSRTIATDLDNVYVLEVMLTMDGSGKVSQIDWRWWKRESGSWLTPSDSDLAGALEHADFEIGQASWVGPRVNGQIALTATGSVVPPAQGFTPGTFRVSYSDTTGYHYGFEWR